jgi:hypothetical protein
MSNSTATNKFTHKRVKMTPTDEQRAARFLQDREAKLLLEKNPP